MTKRFPYAVQAVYRNPNALAMTTWQGKTIINHEYFFQTYTTLAEALDVALRLSSWCGSSVDVLDAVSGPALYVTYKNGKAVNVAAGLDLSTGDWH